MPPRSIYTTLIIVKVNALRVTVDYTFSLISIYTYTPDTRVQPYRRPFRNSFNISEQECERVNRARPA